MHNKIDGMLQDSRKKLNKDGMTILELLTVMVIIGILVLLALPNYMGFSRGAEATSLMNDAKVITDAITTYHAEHGEWPTYLGAVGDRSNRIIPSAIDPYLGNISEDNHADAFYIYDIEGRIHLIEPEDYVIDKKGDKVVSNDKDLNDIANGRY